MLKRAIPAPTAAQQQRQDDARAAGCIACRMEPCKQPFPTEIHHQTSYGRQIGQDHTEAECSWHHRGICLPGLTTSQMTRAYGPSLATDSKAFAIRYGGNVERLDFQNALIGWKGTPEPYHKRKPLTSKKCLPRVA